MRYAQVLPQLEKPLNRLFTYLIPPALAGQAASGRQVVIPFGPRKVIGLLTEVAEQPPPGISPGKLKPLEEVLPEELALSAASLELARWIADHYCCSLEEAVRPFLPEGNPARRLRKVNGRWTLLPPAARARQQRMVKLAAAPEQAGELAREMQKRAPKRAAAILTLLESGPMPSSRLAGLVGAGAVQALAKAGVLAYASQPVRRVPWGSLDPEVLGPHRLNADQQQAVAAILAGLDRQPAPVFLLHGVTGSGKTEVFLRAVQEVLARGEQAIVLIPEISLTAQAMARFRGRFGEQVALIHSALSPGERFDEWRRVRSGQAGVVVGARSALFAPCPRLGLIVIDEEHDPAYKQESSPRYHARETAIRRGRLEGAPVVLASATPSVESYLHARGGHFHLLELPIRIDNRPLPAVKVLDMRGPGRTPRVISAELERAISQRLQAGEQVILFLNRRGYSTCLLCPACGHLMRCPECSVSLAYHRQGHLLKCHHCGKEQPAPAFCPRCASPQVQYQGFGTERVEAEIARLFPSARIGRLDRDTTARKGSHLRIVGDFRRTETDLLIGTQMVAKGFDFPGVTLVGVIAADTSLHLPEFQAGEQTFQLIEQVSGRAGRGDRPGEVVLQTYHPDHYAIQAACRHDYAGFFERETEQRRQPAYPPFVRLANLLLSAADEDQAAQAAAQVAAACQQAAQRLELPVEVLGPSQSPLARIKSRYRWHVLLRAPRHLQVRAALQAALTNLPESVRALLTIDVDPGSLM